jgi:hypothetical protein
MGPVERAVREGSLDSWSAVVRAPSLLDFLRRPLVSERVDQPVECRADGSVDHDHHGHGEEDPGDYGCDQELHTITISHLVGAGAAGRWLGQPTTRVRDVVLNQLVARGLPAQFDFGPRGSQQLCEALGHVGGGHLIPAAG